LKRIQSSIKLWTKQGGRQGYLDCINPDNLSKLNYPVLIEEKEGGYQATVWGLPEFQVFAATREDALNNLHKLMN
jgi:hypothetical protein